MWVKQLNILWKYIYLRGFRSISLNNAFQSWIVTRSITHMFDTKNVLVLVVWKKKLCISSSYKNHFRVEEKSILFFRAQFQSKRIIKIIFWSQHALFLHQMFTSFQWINVQLLLIWTVIQSKITVINYTNGCSLWVE